LRLAGIIVLSALISFLLIILAQNKVYNPFKGSWNSFSAWFLPRALTFYVFEMVVQTFILSMRR
jgi:hypothetical protein